MQSTFLTVHRISYFVNSCILSITLQNSNSDKMMDDNTPFIAEVLHMNDNAPSYPDDFFQLQVKKNADIIADQSEIRLIALENAEAKSDDENKVVIDTFTTIELAESRAELAMVKSELAEVRAELATVKANQSHSDDFAQRNEHRIELDQSQCIHHMKEVSTEGNDFLFIVNFSSG